MFHIDAPAKRGQFGWGVGGGVELSLTQSLSYFSLILALDSAMAKLNKAMTKSESEEIPLN